MQTVWKYIVPLLVESQIAEPCNILAFVVISGSIDNILYTLLQFVEFHCLSQLEFFIRDECGPFQTVLFQFSPEREIDVDFFLFFFGERDR